MKIIQYEDGSGKLMFSDQEIKILKKRAYIEFPAEGMKHFSNSLMNLVISMQEKIPEDKKNLVSNDGQHIAPKDE